MDNKIYKDCSIHRRNCQFFCTYSKCEVKILCEKCIKDHLRVHPRSFIYNVQNLSQIHSFDKIGKMKQTLGKQKIANEQKIKQVYTPFQTILNPLISKVKQFERISRQMMTKQFLAFLATNKNIIQSCKIKKTDPTKVKVLPQVMIQQTILEVQMITEKQNQLKQNTQRYTAYSDATSEMSLSAQKQINTIIELIHKLLDGYFKIQFNKFQQSFPNKGDLQYEPFFLKYINVHKIASKIQNNSLELTLMQFKKQMSEKQQELKIAKMQIKDHLMKIQQLNARINRLKEQLYQWQSKQQRQQRQRKEALTLQRQKLQQFLIRNQVVSNQSKTISLQKKVLQQKYLTVLLQMVPNPNQLILSQHSLASHQLEYFLKYTNLHIFRMSFIPIDQQFLRKALSTFENIHTLQLNTANITDIMLDRISGFFPSKIRHLHLIDNSINDQGLEKMFINLVKCQIRLDSLYVSYNSLSSNGVDIINRYSYDLKVLHISKNPIRTKGVISIARGLKNLQQLFIGGTQAGKQGIVSICKNLQKLKKLSLVATQISTDIVSQILLGLQKLQWLDVSYSSMTPAEMKKIQKLRAYNKNIQIILQT